MDLPDSYLQYKEGSGDIQPLEPVPVERIQRPAVAIFYFISISIVFVLIIILLIGYSSARGNPFSPLANYFHIENWWGSRENIGFISDAIPQKRVIENSEFDTKIALIYKSISQTETGKDVSMDLNVDLNGISNTDETTSLKTSLSGSVNLDSGRFNFSIPEGSLTLSSKYTGGNLFYNVFATPQMSDIIIDNKDSRAGLTEYLSRDIKVVGVTDFYNRLMFDNSAYWQSGLNAYNLSKISPNDDLYTQYFSIYKSFITLSKDENIVKKGRTKVFSGDDSILFHMTPQSSDFKSKKSKFLSEIFVEISKSANVIADDYCANSDRSIAQACHDKFLQDLTNVDIQSLQTFFEKVDINYIDYYIDAVSGRLNKYEFEIELPSSTSSNFFENSLFGSNVFGFYLKISQTNKGHTEIQKIEVQNGGLLYDDFYKILFGGQ